MRKASEIATEFAQRDELAGRTTFYLVGIGGAGMSALARMLKHRGFSVRGSDSTNSPDVQRLIREGIEVSIGHRGAPVEAMDPTRSAVVLTDAIDLGSSPEVAAARTSGVPIFRRSQALGWLLKDKKVIAVTGTHGKTTTTGMLGNALAEAGLDPLVVVGAVIPQFGGPVREGNGEWAVVEACEAYDSFHDIAPHDVVLTNLELDHVDFHGTFDNLIASVLRFVNSMPDDGTLVFCADDEGAIGLAEEYLGGKVGYHLNGEMATEMRLPGRHNQLNLKGVMEAARLTGADPVLALRGASEFRGAERRLQVLQDGDVTVIDDYAHHPTEVRASLGALRERYTGRRLVVVFQPHLYSRTEPLIHEFAECLSLADVVVLTDIYPAREVPIPGVSSSRIAEAVTKPVHYVPSRHLLPMEVARFVQSGDVVVGMGAGSIGEFGPAFIDELQRRGRKPEVAVIYAGDSAEREVSILSGRAIQAALQSRGYRATLVDVTDILLKGEGLSMLVGPNRPEVAFLTVHGTHMEGGAAQGLMELLHLPYTGSGMQASATAMDKALTKKLLDQHGIRVPFGALLTSPEQAVPVKAPLVVKPNAQGSTVGLSMVERDEDVRSAVERAFAYDSAVLVEEWIRGMEISVPVLGDLALLPVEIAPASGFYDFASKYTPGATEEIVPARLPAPLLKRAQDIALKVHQTLGCAGATRTDMIVRGEEIFVLEINTLPGMTGTSLLPNSANAAGIPFDDLCERLVLDALRRHEAKA